MQSAEQQRLTQLETEANLKSAALFDHWDEQEFEPQDFMVDVPVDSLESCVGYSSLLRQMQKSYLRTVAFYRSKAGGALSIEEARAQAFRSCNNEEEAKQLLSELMSYPVDNLSFADLNRTANHRAACCREILGNGQTRRTRRV